MDSEQAEQLQRVKRRLAAVILEFLATLEAGAEFHMTDLTQYVTQRLAQTAPDSPGRILRDLRKAGLIRYRVVSRPQSRYCFEGLGAE